MQANNQINFTKLLNLSAFIFVIGIMISFGSSWLITKILNKQQVGTYQLMISILETGALIATAGFQYLALREVPNLVQHQQKFNRFFKQAFRAMLLSLSFLCPILYSIFYYLSPDTNFNTPLLIALCILPAFTILKFLSAVLHALGWYYTAILPEKIIRPILIVILAIILYYTSNQGDDNLIYILTLIGVFTILIGMLFYAKIQKIIQQFTQQAAKINYYKSAIILVPYFLLSNLTLKIDGFMILALDELENFAIYSQAVKFAFLSSFGLLIYEHVFAPQIALKRNELDQKIINKIIVKKIRLVFLASVGIFLLSILGGEWVLSSFGKPTEQYKAGYLPLIILGIAQLFSVSVGPTSNILILKHKEKAALISVGIALSSNILLNYLLIPRYQINGAAFASAISILLWNCSMYYFVKKQTNFKTAIFDQVD